MNHTDGFAIGSPVLYPAHWASRATNTKHRLTAFTTLLAIGMM